jgi:hypothetical protein
MISGVLKGAVAKILGKKCQYFNLTDSERQVVNKQLAEAYSVPESFAPTLREQERAFSASAAHFALPDDLGALLIASSVAIKLDQTARFAMVQLFLDLPRQKSGTSSPVTPASLIVSTHSTAEMEHCRAQYHEWLTLLMARKRITEKASDS